MSVVGTTLRRLPSRAAHPDRLAVLARLHGLPYPSHRSFRYLELRSGDGGHLLGLADAHPDATFVGVESQSTQRDLASNLARRAGLDNVRFVPAVADCDGAEAYDFVVSEVPFHSESTLTATLQACARLLTERGLTLVGYDALPGSRVRAVVADVVERLSRRPLRLPARQALELLRESPAGGRGVELLGHEIAGLAALDDERLVAELLSSRLGFLFHEVVSRAHDRGLTFVSEATISSSNPRQVPEHARSFLATIHDRVEREQYLDFLLWRKARRSVFSRAPGAVAESCQSEALHGTWLMSPLLADAAAPSRASVFRGPGGSNVRITDPLLAGVIRELGPRFPEACEYTELAGKLSRDGNDSSHLANVVLRAYQSDLLDILLSPRACARAVPDRPRVSRLTMTEAELGRPLTSRLHTPCKPRGALTGRLVPLLDGKRTVAELVEMLEVGPEALEPSQVRGELERLGRLGLLLTSERVDA